MGLPHRRNIRATSPFETRCHSASKTRVNALMAPLLRVRSGESRGTAQQNRCIRNNVDRACVCGINLPRSNIPSYTRHALLVRRRRRSRHLKTEQGAAADNACRDGAPRGARAPRKGPRAPGPPLPSKPWVPEAWRVAGFRSSPAEEVSQTSWAPPGAPSLSFGRVKENRETGRPGARKTLSRDSEALAESRAQPKGGSL